MQIPPNPTPHPQLPWRLVLPEDRGTIHQGLELDPFCRTVKHCDVKIPSATVVRRILLCSTEVNELVCSVNVNYFVAMGGGRIKAGEYMSTCTRVWVEWRKLQYVIWCRCQWMAYWRPHAQTMNCNHVQPIQSNIQPATCRCMWPRIITVDDCSLSFTSTC